jgi:hypothetical protein
MKGDICPEYAQIQTFITCTRQTLPLVTAQYAKLLESLRCTDNQFMKALLSVPWPSKEDEVLIEQKRERRLVTQT